MYFSYLVGWFTLGTGDKMEECLSGTGKLMGLF
jgi:hypothetical protein